MDCVVAFQQLKDYLSRSSIMSSPEADEVLYAYIAVAPHAVSLVLIRDDNGIQKSVYYVSKSLHELGPRYAKVSPLFPSPHSGCSNPTTLEVCTSNRRLHWKDCHMEHNSRSF